MYDFTWDTDKQVIRFHFSISNSRFRVWAHHVTLFTGFVWNTYLVSRTKWTCREFIIWILFENHVILLADDNVIIAFISSYKESGVINLSFNFESTSISVSATNDSICWNCTIYDFSSFPIYHWQYTWCSKDVFFFLFLINIKRCYTVIE